MAQEADEKKISYLAGLLRAAAEKNRLKILCRIFDKEKICVSQIARSAKLSVAVSSHHLRVLARRGILKPVRQGKRICYEVSDSRFVLDLKKLICKYR